MLYKIKGLIRKKGKEMEENFTHSSLKEATESFTPLKLRSRVKPFEANNWDDIDSVRTCMKTLGCYGGQPVEHVNKCMMDPQLRSSIEKKQKEYGLTIDGTLFPSGETERALNNELEKRRNEAEEQAKKQEREMEDVKRRIQKEEEALNKPEAPAQRMCMIDPEDIRADKLTKELFSKVDEKRAKDKEKAMEEKRRKELREAEERRRKYEPNGKIEEMLHSFLSKSEIGQRKWEIYKDLNRENISDTIKHKEMSCEYAKEEGGWGMVGLGLGIGKEGFDILTKSFDKEARKRYGGFRRIFEDSVKDFRNDMSGLTHGTLYPYDDCKKWARDKE